MERVSPKQSFVVDTDIFIDFFRGYPKSLPFFKEIEKSTYDAYVSVITVMELMSGKSTKSIEEQIKIKKVLELFKIIEVNYSIAELAGFIKRDYNTSFPDALIASSAKLLRNNTIVTKNKKHFQNIKKIKIMTLY